MSAASTLVSTPFALSTPLKGGLLRQHGNSQKSKLFYEFLTHHTSARPNTVHSGQINEAKISAAARRSETDHLPSGVDRSKPDQRAFNFPQPDLALLWLHVYGSVQVSSARLVPLPSPSRLVPMSVTSAVWRSVYRYSIEARSELPAAPTLAGDHCHRNGPRL